MSSSDRSSPNQSDESKNRKHKPRKGGKSGVGTSLPAPGDVLSIYPGSQETLAMSIGPAPLPLFDSSVGTNQDVPVFQHMALDQGRSGREVLQFEQLEISKEPQQLKDLRDLWSKLPSVDHLQFHQWDLSRFLVQELPLYFPVDNLQYQFPSTEVVDVCERLSRKIRVSSIQVRFDSNPLSAKLETREGVELYVVFFQNPRKRKNSGGSGTLSSGVVYLSIQRRKGDKAVAAEYTQQLLDAAKGINSGDDGDVEDESRGDAPMNHESLMEMESVIERLVAGANAGNESANEGNPFAGKSHEQITESAVQDVYHWFTAKGLDPRRQAMDYLLQMTDMRRTMSSTAIAGALVIIQGTGPSPRVAEQAQTIRNLVLLILMTRELPNDRAMLVGMEVKAEHDRDDETKPYFPDPLDDGNQPTLPHFYTEYMSQLFHMALQILVQSLEVVACFHETLTREQGINIEDMARDLFAAAADVAPGKDLYATLLGCIDRAESKLANGYLACKALRLLAIGFPALKQRLRDDEHARTSIGNAFQVGTTCYTLLKVESEQLWLTVSAP